MTLLCKLTVQCQILTGTRRFITACRQLITVYGASLGCQTERIKSAGTAKEMLVSDAACISQDFNAS